MAVTDICQIRGISPQRFSRLMLAKFDKNDVTEGCRMVLRRSDRSKRRKIRSGENPLCPIFARHPWFMQHHSVHICMCN